MKETITYRFNNFKRQDIGRIPTLSKAVRGMKYGVQVVTDAFNKFVPKAEYELEEKDEILEWLYTQNKNEKEPEKTFKIKDLKNTN
jgi:hypothetical protein